LSGHSGDVDACSFSPDGSNIISASKDGLKLWDAASGRELSTLSGQEPCAFSPDGTHAVSASTDNTLKIWDVAEGETILVFKLDSRPLCLDWSRNWRLVVGTRLGSVYILEFDNMRLGPPVITAWRRVIWKGVFRRQREECIAFGCPLCRVWSPADETHLGTVVHCSSCGESLRLNNFTIDADWLRASRAWKGRSTVLAREQDPTP
jgi:WD40 repeat protein